MGCRSSVVYTLFSFPEIQCVYQVIKLLIVHLKKKKGMEQVQMVVIPWHSLERFMNAEKKIAKSMYWYIWHDYGDQLIN